MRALGLLEDLRSRGVEVKADGGYLELDAPAGVLTPELVSELRAHKAGILRVLERREGARRDPEPLASTAEVFEMAREYFGSSEPFDPSEHPVSKRELWADPAKAAFYGEVREEDARRKAAGEMPWIRRVSGDGGNRSHVRGRS